MLTNSITAFFSLNLIIILLLLMAVSVSVGRGLQARNTRLIGVSAPVDAA